MITRLFTKKRSWLRTYLFAWGFAAVLAIPPLAYGNGTMPCFQQELDAFTTNAPLYDWPYYTAEKDIFGSSMAISGDTLAVGSPWAARRFFRYEPAVYIYVRSAGRWRLQQKIITPLGWANGGSQSSFGFSVALEGNTLVVGDPTQLTTWIYERSGSVWSVAPGGYLPANEILSAPNDFGHTVSVSGDSVVVGDSGAHAYLEMDPSLPPSQRYRYPGSVSVFRRVNGVWTFEQEFSPGLPFGALVLQPVAISDNTIAVFRGRVHIYRHSVDGWSEVKQLIINNSDLEPPPYVLPHALSMDENYIVVGTGKAAYIFQNVNGTWSLQTRLPASSVSYFDPMWYFGLSTAIYGQTIAVSDRNSTRVYQLADGEWTERYTADLSGQVNGPPAGYLPVTVAVGDDALVASDNFPSQFYAEVMLFGDYPFYDRAPSSREAAYFSTQDVLAPSVAQLAVSTARLWPPDHQMVDVMLSYELWDNCGSAGVTSEVTITSDEPEAGTGSGDTAPDWEVVDGHHVRLRAERAGSGDGRVYTIRVTVRDGAGNSSWQSINVTVPHD